MECAGVNSSLQLPSLPLHWLSSDAPLITQTLLSGDVHAAERFTRAQNINRILNANTFNPVMIYPATVDCPAVPPLHSTRTHRLASCAASSSLRLPTPSSPPSPLPSPLWRLPLPYLECCTAPNCTALPTPSLCPALQVGVLCGIFLIAFAYAVISPITTIACLGFFAMSWLFWRYNLMYVVSHRAHT